MNIFETHIFIVKVSMYVGVAFLISSSLLLLIILLNRIRVIAMDRRERRYVKKWRKSLLDTIDNKPIRVDFIPNEYKEISLIVWNDFQDLLKGVERERLNKMAKSLSLDSFAITLLKSNREDKKLLGVQTLGNLAEEDYFPKIENLFSNSKSLTIVLESLHTMVKINPERSVGNLLYFFKTRDYYPDYKIAVILQDLGAKTFSISLANFILQTSIEKQRKLINYFVFGTREEALRLALNFLNNSDDPELISASIKLVENFGSSKHTTIVKRFLDHEQAFIRINAVKAIGVIGSTNDIEDLEDKLADFSWWVRLRAAEAIKNLPGVTEYDLRKIRNRQMDDYAKDIMNYLLAAERE